MKSIFKLLFLPFTIMKYIFALIKGLLFGILLFPLAAIGIDPFHHH